MITYEDFYELLLEGAIESGLKVYGEKHNIDVNTCDKTCEFICVLEADEPVYNIRAELSFAWDALQTYQSVYQDIDIDGFNNDVVPQCVINMEINYCFDITVPQKTEQLAKLIRRIIQQKLGARRFFTVETEIVLMPNNNLFIRESRASFDLEIEITGEEMKIKTPLINRQEDAINKETDMSTGDIFLEIKDILEAIANSGEFSKEEN
jgi:hypothetical protein